MTSRRALSLLAVAALGCSSNDVVAIIGARCRTANDCPSAASCIGGVCVSNPPANRECAPVRLTELCVPKAPDFSRGACVCADFVTASSVAIDGFDSRQSPLVYSTRSGSFGVNGFLNGSASLTIGGTLTVAGLPGITLSGGGVVTIGGDLHDQGVFQGADRLDVDGNAEIGGLVDVGELSIGGTLLTPDGASVNASRSKQVGNEVHGPVTVAAPCACDPSSQPDIPGIIAAHRTTNDNASTELDALRLDDVETPLDVALPCGDYHLTRLGGSAPLDLSLNGPTRLFIDDNVAFDKAFRVHFSGAGKLDLFIGGDIRVDGPLELGAPEDAGRVRVFIAGEGTLLMTDDARIAGLLCAPKSEVVSEKSLEVFGALFVRRAAPAGPLSVHEDRALLTGLPECAP